MATQVEGQVLLPQVDGGKIASLARGGQLVQRGVCAGHVGGVVLVVVQLHDAPGDVGLKSGVVVGQIRQGVGGHDAPSVGRQRMSATP